MRRVSHAAIMLGAVLMLSAPYLRLARANRMDDYLITLRYGRNVAQGLGAVYNPGERFQGFTSPLQLGLSSSLFLLSPGPEGVPNLFGILGLFAIVTIALNVVYWVTGRLALFPVIASLAIFLSSQLLFEFAPFDTVWAIALGATAISLGRARRYAPVTSSRSCRWSG